MMTRVLIPLDGSPEAEAILDEAIKVGGPGAEYVLLAVVTPLGAMAGALRGRTTGPDVQVDADALARRYLEGLVRRLATVAPRTTFEVIPAPSAAPAIVHEATAGGYDLVAMTTHGRSGLRRVLLGSVAEEVLRNSTVPLLLRRPGSATGPTEPA